jgi:hypothetical protein
MSSQPTGSEPTRRSTLSLRDNSGKEIVSIVRNQSSNNYSINGNALTTFPKDTEWATLKAVMNFVTKTVDIKLTSVDGATEYYIDDMGR